MYVYLDTSLSHYGHPYVDLNMSRIYIAHHVQFDKKVFPFINKSLVKENTSSISYASTPWLTITQIPHSLMPIVNPSSSNSSPHSIALSPNKTRTTTHSPQCSPILQPNLSTTSPTSPHEPTIIEPAKHTHLMVTRGQLGKNFSKPKHANLHEYQVIPNDTKSHQTHHVTKHPISPIPILDLEIEPLTFFPS